MYSFVIYIYALLIKLVSPFHPKAKRMLIGQRQTFDILKKQMDPSARYIWVHAASLGEFEQGRPLIEKLRLKHSEYKILLTFFSPSGYEVRKDYEGADIVCYLPMDTPGRSKQFLDTVAPVMAIFIKYEFWANYLYGLKRRNIPTYIISAIFRKKQLFFKPYGAGYRKVLSCFTHLFVQDEISASLLKAYGIDRVTVAGDTRFDRVADIQAQAKDIPLVDRFVHTATGEKCFTLVAGSSWQADEGFLIEYFNLHPGIKLIIAPHEIHESHLVEIESYLKRPSLRLSQATADNVDSADCLIVDCFGKLSSIYRYGEVAYIGGGFGTGIHNILEAAVYGIPVVFGPNYRKFKEARDLLSIGGGVSVAGGAAFSTRMNCYISYEALQQEVGKAAGEFVQAHTGATDRVLKDLSQLL
jgi:3-deoxy-D-manno-octulosonic-acid transferase